MTRDPAKVPANNDPSKAKGKKRRSTADAQRNSATLARTSLGKPGTGRPDADETYRGSKQGPK